MTTHQEALLPCPFCGGKDSPKLKLWDGTPPIPGFYVVCDAAGWEGMEGRGCGCSGAYGEDKNEAIAAWNRRLTTLALADNGLVERLLHRQTIDLGDISALRSYLDANGILHHEAADTIAAQAAEIERLKAQLVHFGELAALEHREQAARISALEALLDKAVEAIRSLLNEPECDA